MAWSEVKEIKRANDKKADLAIYDSVTKKLKDDLHKSADQPRPDSLLKRLEDILIQCAIIPSAKRGLLGDTNNISVSGDGSAMPSGASPYGKPSCNCREKGIYNCDCPRYYSDLTANWGYNSYRETYYFGHTYYQHIVSTNGHDLLSIAPASETDYTLSMKSLERLRKALKENGLEWKIQYAIHDAGHDSTGNYEYLLDYGVSVKSSVSWTIANRFLPYLFNLTTLVYTQESFISLFWHFTLV